MDGVRTVMIMQPHLGALAGALEPAGYAVAKAWEAPDAGTLKAVRALVVAGEFPLDKALIEQLPKLGLIACFTAGYDGIDADWAHARGLQVSYAPGVNHEEVADHALALILAFRRQIVAGDRAVRGGGWDRGAKPLTASVKGQRVGLVGLGRIGQALAVRCEACAMIVSWWGPHPKPGARWPRAGGLLALAEESDVLVVACRADETNRGLVSREVISALGADGLLVNVARGQLVDEDALIAALEAGTLGGAALDVFRQEPTPPGRWAGVPNTVLTPHTAGATTASVAAMVELLRRNLAAFFAGQPLITPL